MGLTRAMSSAGHHRSSKVAIVLETDRVRQPFSYAKSLQADALEMLALGDVRNAAEKAWGATKRATCPGAG